MFVFGPNQPSMTIVFRPWPSAADLAVATACESSSGVSATRTKLSGANVGASAQRQRTIPSLTGVVVVTASSTCCSAPIARWNL
jgi:hypothetical protein